MGDLTPPVDEADGPHTLSSASSLRWAPSKSDMIICYPTQQGELFFFFNTYLNAYLYYLHYSDCFPYLPHIHNVFGEWNLKPNLLFCPPG